MPAAMEGKGFEQLNEEGSKSRLLPSVSEGSGSSWDQDTRVLLQPLPLFHQGGPEWELRPPGAALAAACFLLSALLSLCG